MEKHRGRPVIIGGAVMDFRGKPHNQLQLYTSNPGLLQETPGGVGRNIAENLVRLGVQPFLISAVGCDMIGDTLLRHMENIGLDTRGIVRIDGERTAIYLAILAQDGDLHTAIADMTVFEELTPSRILTYRAQIAEASLVIMDTNLSRAALQAVAQLCREAQVPLFVEPVSVEKSKKLAGLSHLITYISPNLDELAALAGIPIDSLQSPEEAVQILLKAGVEHVIVTQGEKGVLYAADGLASHFPALKANVVDVTGAGDAFVAGMAYGLLREMNVERAIQCGLVTAKYTVETAETVSSLLNEGLFKYS